VSHPPNNEAHDTGFLFSFVLHAHLPFRSIDKRIRPQHRWRRLKTRRDEEEIESPREGETGEIAFTWRDRALVPRDGFRSMVSHHPIILPRLRGRAEAKTCSLDCRRDAHLYVDFSSAHRGSRRADRMKRDRRRGSKAARKARGWGNTA